MGNTVELKSADGQTIPAYVATPAGQPRGAVVVLQEIFGVNSHIRSVADGYAAEGYAVLAPAFFDPVERGVELGYDEAGFARGRELVGALGIEAAMEIVDAAATQLRARLAAFQAPQAVGTVGYCWGGTVAMLAALRLGLPSVSYYGARDLPFLEDRALVAAPRAPVMFHFGEQDSSITADAVEAHRRALPAMAVHTYPAGHAFNRDVDPDAYGKGSATLARARSLAFFAEHLR